MTVRYTAVEGMDDPALRDLDRTADRWRDKIEVRLDNRQVFFLFFGSAVVACMLFVLGVMVGKRIESRGQAAAPEMQDPLAALARAHDKPAAGAPAPELTFPNTLIAPASRSKAAKLAAAPAAASRPVVSPAAPKPTAQSAAPPRPVAPAPAPPKPVATPAAAKPAAAPALPKPAATTASPGGASKPAAAAPAGDPGKGKYTLHLSTFATAVEANAFAQRYPGAFVVGGDVPGRGIAYRVRYGNFPTYKDATSAKDSFEKQHNTIALIAAR